MPVLARNEICKRLDARDSERWIFLPESCDVDQVRGAAYDLRVAPDYLITPKGTRYWPGGPEGYRRRTASFLLRPGEVAFVSSLERLCMPWDLAGNIAPKFRFALDGILVMGGLLVDPGYGRVEGDDGSWIVSGEGGRLHFQLANLGTDPLRVKPGKTSVAALQLIELLGDSRREIRDGKEAAVENLQVPNSGELLTDLFHPGADKPLEPLFFFSETADINRQFDRVLSEVDRSGVRMEENERSTDRLVVFGVFLVSITLFTVAVAALIDALAGSSVKDVIDTGGEAELTWTGFAIAVLMLAIVGRACWLMMRPVAEIVDRRGGEREKKQKEGEGGEKERVSAIRDLG